jgi:hypothetical protein
MVGSQVQQPRRQVLLGHGSWRRDVREGCALCVRELPPCLGWLLRRVLGAARVKAPPDFCWVPSVYNAPPSVCVSNNSVSKCTVCNTEPELFVSFCRH